MKSSMKSSMKKSLLASVLLAMGSITQQIAAESHYYPPRYATQSFAPDVAASGAEEAGAQESAQKMEAREQQNSQAEGDVTVLPYSEDEEVVEGIINVPGDED